MEKDVLSSCQECGTKKKNSESPWGVNLQTFRFHAPMLNSLPSLLFYNYKMTLLTLLIQAVWRTRVNFMMSLSHHWVSLAQRESIRAWNLNVWGLIPHRDSDILLCPTLVTRRKTYFSIIRIVWQTVRRITNKPWKCLLVLGYKGLCVHTNTKRRSPLKCRATSHFTINY